MKVGRFFLLLEMKEKKEKKKNEKKNEKKRMKEKERVGKGEMEDIDERERVYTGCPRAKRSP